MSKYSRHSEIRGLKIRIFQKLEKVFECIEHSENRSSSSNCEFVMASEFHSTKNSIVLSQADRK